MNLRARLADLLRPPVCLGCDRPGAWPLCVTCLPPEPAGPGPWRLAADPTVPLWTLGLYRGGLRQAILAGKLRGQGDALDALGRRLGAATVAAGLGADLLTWVPSRPRPLRPADHAHSIAAGMAAVLGLPLAALLVPPSGPDRGRTRADRRDAASPGVPGVLRRLAEAVPRRRWVPPTASVRLAGGRVLVVDDVTTTGGTLAGAAAALRAAGARGVQVAVLGAAPGALGPPALNQHGPRGGRAAPGALGPPDAAG